MRKDDGMRPFHPAIGLLISLAAPAGLLRSEEAHASVYVVERSAESAAAEALCHPYAATSAPGPGREILALAKGPPGSTVLMVAFAGDAPHLGLAPVLAAQSEESPPARFPAEGASWPYETAGEAVDLYIAVFDRGDPGLPKLVDAAARLSGALTAKKSVEAMLHAEEVRKALSQVMRRLGVQAYRVDYGTDPASLRERSAPKAATTRGGSLSLAKPKEEGGAKGAPDAPRRLGSLDAEWLEDARPISFGLASPGALVFPIAKPETP